MNGKAVGYFSCTRGVRQGDPLSPLLFCLAEECLSCFFELERINNSLQPMSYCRGISLPTHILYADDVFICCVGSRKNIKCLLHIFQTYSDISGQLVNFEKSKLFTGAMTVTRRNMLSHLSGFAVGTIGILVALISSLHAPSILHYYCIVVGVCSRKTRNALASFSSASFPMVSLAQGTSNPLFGLV